MQGTRIVIREPRLPPAITTPRVTMEQQRNLHERGGEIPHNFTNSFSLDATQVTFSSSQWDISIT